MSAVTQDHKPDAPQEAPLRSEGSAVPVWLIVLLALVGYWALLQLNDHGGGFQPHVYGPYASVGQQIDAWPVIGVDLNKGRKVFETYCQACHQPTGLGMPGQFPPLAGSDWVANPSPNRIIRIVLNGCTGPITVSGKSFNNTMLPWKDTLKDDEIAAVLSFVRGNKDWGNSAPIVKEAEIKAIREKIKDRSTSFTPDELLKLGDGE